MRDIENDKSAGKITIPVRIGKRNAFIYQCILISVALLCISIYAFVAGPSLLFAVAALYALPLGVQLRKISKNEDLKLLDGELKKTAMLTLLIVIFFFLFSIRGLMIN